MHNRCTRLLSGTTGSTTMIWDVILAGGLFLFTIPVWIYLYKTYLGNILADIYVSKIESGQIDLNYLLDEGGVFDELTERIITRFKQNMLAEMGQMSHQAGSGESAIANYELDPVAGGLEIAGELLKHVGMKRPPAMLQYKVAQALGQLMNNSKGSAGSDDYSSFFPDRP